MIVADDEMERLRAVGDHQCLVVAVEFGEVTTCPQVPSLHCKNGSTCTPGIASFGEQHDHLDLQTHDSGYHCKCENGFIGHECEVLVEECSGNANAPMCYNGAKCKSSGGTCDCKALNQDSGATDTKFEGNMCQYESTSFCAVSLVGNHAPDYQFCTNHGECVRLVSGGEPHPGCVCKDGWLGNHCEVRGDPFATQSSKENQGGEGTNSTTALLSSMIVLIAIVTLGIIFALIKHRKMRNAATILGSPALENPTSRRKSEVGEGDLDADGSGTLGNQSTAENGTDNVDAKDLTMEEDDEDEKINGTKPIAEIV
ncbi:hypothetical protein ACHAW5_009603 [Stephanodiscus triporus]|uniref:EGF-like domain-containing protein n=1 Tax=Stephanodiscus triporus TaxID=2934178 RepID=A0ABD3MJ04_9STRA